MDRYRSSALRYRLRRGLSRSIPQIHAGQVPIWGHLGLHGISGIRGLRVAEFPPRAGQRPRMIRPLGSVSPDDMSGGAS